MNPEYQSILAAGVEKKYRHLENEIMKDVVRRIQKTGNITSTADWQLQRYMILGHSTEDVENIVRSAVGGDYVDTFRLYDEVIEQEYVRSKEMYEQVNAFFVPYEQNLELQQLTNALIQQSNDELFNITKSMGFMVDMGNGRKAFTPLSEYYNDYLDNAVLEMASGAFDYNTLIRKVVGQMTASGLRSVDYASGHSNRVDVAARRALLTGMGQLTGHISDRNGAALGTDYFEIDWHPGSRPDHAAWQGRVWSKQELITVCGLGTGPGLLGWNCRHTYYPFIKGVSQRAYSDQRLAEMDRKEAQTKTFRGKEYNTYQATQKQRSMETAMRAQRQKVQLLQQGKADPDDIINAKCKYQAQMDEYKEFSKKFNLPEQRERIYADLRGRVAPSQRTYKEWQAEQARKKAARAQTAQKKLAKQPASAIMKSTADAKDFTQLKDYVKQKYGMRWDNTVDALDFVSVREGLQGIERIMQEFPKARSSFQGIGTKNSGIMCATYHGEINFNPVYYASRQAALDAHKPTSFHPVGNSPFGSGAHEAGHLLEKALIDQTNNGQTFPLGALSWKDCTYAKAVVSDACKAAKKLPECKGMTNRDLKLGISGYATSGGPSECLAEAVSDYAMNGNNAAPLSREIWKILKKELG